MAFGLAANAQNQPNGSIEKEVALGAQLATDFRRMHLPLDSSTVLEYIDQMGAKLVRALPQQSPFPYHFEVTTDAKGTFLEPASVPGGYVFVPVGLILAAKDEEELAGTVAHAMAHILARHWTKQAIQAQVGQSTIPLIFSGSLGYGGDQGALIPVGMLQSRRANESEADLLAVQITATAGYDPEGLARYIGRVQKDEGRLSDDGRDLSSLFSIMPPRDQRVQAIEQRIQALPPQNYVLSSSDFARIQEEVRRALPPNPPPPSLLKHTLKRP